MDHALMRTLPNVGHPFGSDKSNLKKSEKILWTPSLMPIHMLIWSNKIIDV